MANTKISALTAGAPAQANDLVPIDRAGANFSLKVSDVSAEILSSPTITTEVTLPATVTLANTTTLSPTSGSLITLQTPSDNALEISNPSTQGTSSIVLAAGEVNLFGGGGVDGGVAINDGGGGLGIQLEGLVTTNNGRSLTKGGLPSIVAFLSLTTQAAAQSNVNIPIVETGGVTAVAGLYRVSYRAAITRAATTSCTLGGAAGFQVIYTDLNDSVVKTSNPTTPVVSSVNSTGTTISGTLLANCAASTNLNFSFGYTNNGVTTMQYDLDIYVEYLG